MSVSPFISARALTPTTSFCHTIFRGMGQYFILVNIDKAQRVFIGKFGEDYFDTRTTMYLCNPDAQTSWAGDRLILIGDYARDIPAGIEEDGDTIDMFTYNGYGTSSYPWNRDCSYSKTSVLRNLCTREYIRADLFPDDSSHPGFGEVILPKIVWSSDPSMSMPMEIDPRGPWAGGRFDVVDVDAVKDDNKWKDITEIEFFNYYTMWSADRNEVDGCPCELCQKYRNEHEDFYENINKKNQSQQSEKVHETIEDGTTPKSWSPTATRGFRPSSTNSPSTIEVLPAEVQEDIMVYLSLGDLAACAAASRALSPQAMRLLYTSVPLEHASQTKVLLTTISRRPELTSYIKDIRVVSMAHWESLQVAHELLTQLPALKSLEFAPCWLSYGDLSYWEYPFTLSTLKWGLKEDSAFDRFCQSQPGAQTVLLDPFNMTEKEEGGEEGREGEEEEEEEEEERERERESLYLAIADRYTIEEPRCDLSSSTTNRAWRGK